MCGKTVRRRDVEIVAEVQVVDAGYGSELTSHAGALELARRTCLQARQKVGTVGLPNVTQVQTG